MKYLLIYCRTRCLSVGTKDRQKAHSEFGMAMPRNFISVQESIIPRPEITLSCIGVVRTHGGFLRPGQNAQQSWQLAYEYVERLKGPGTMVFL